MNRLLMMGAAALAITACSDGGTNPVSSDGSAPALVVAPTGPKYTLFTTLTPAGDVSATGGWEVATRFKASEPGRVVGFRFWRAAGETGSNQGRLWTNGGSLLRTATFPHSGRAGWDSVMFTANQPRLPANTYFRVSVNTNAYQAKTFRSSPFSITNGPLTADMSYYGQPTGSMPTTGSYSQYFVDVIFIPDGALANLYVASVTHHSAGPSVTIRVCNNGTAASVPTITRMEHWVGFTDNIENLSTSSLAAGQCENLWTEVSWGLEGVPHSYYIRVDEGEDDYESNEGDNYYAVEGLS